MFKKYKLGYKLQKAIDNLEHLPPSVNLTFRVREAYSLLDKLCENEIDYRIRGGKRKTRVGLGAESLLTLNAHRSWAVRCMEGRSDELIQYARNYLLNHRAHFIEANIPFYFKAWIWAARKYQEVYYQGVTLLKKLKPPPKEEVVTYKYYEDAPISKEPGATPLVPENQDKHGIKVFACSFCYDSGIVNPAIERWGCEPVEPNEICTNCEAGKTLKEKNQLAASQAELEEIEKLASEYRQLPEKELEQHKKAVELAGQPALKELLEEVDKDIKAILEKR